MGDHSLLYLGLPSPHLPQRSKRAREGVVVSLLLHVCAAAVLGTLAVKSVREVTSPPVSRTAETPIQLPRIVFLPAPGPGGGGGGGGNRQPGPPSRAQGIGRDRLTLPVARPIVPTAKPEDAASPPHLLVLNATPMAAGTSYQIGMPEAPASLPFSQGPGSGGGVGEGEGTGIGPGRGPGFGPGYGGGFGDGAYRPGNNVTAPTLITQVRPSYTPHAMQRKIQGTVILDVIVDRNGVPSAIRVARSLDADGLDVEAMRAVQQWRFNPGRMGGTPVDVLVKIVLDFTIH
jgi:TonB family protein